MNCGSIIVIDWGKNGVGETFFDANINVYLHGCS